MLRNILFISFILNVQTFQQTTHSTFDKTDTITHDEFKICSFSQLNHFRKKINLA